MIRLNMIVEGQTEETFAHLVLEEPLAARHVFLSVGCVETSRDRRAGKIYRGGLLDYDRARKDLLRWMKEDSKPEARFTTMFDLYALPDNFPGQDEARKRSNPNERVAELEKAFVTDIPDPRFLPYIQLHEFEALLLVDPTKFDWEFIEHTEAISQLVQLSEQFPSPELIDDGEHTAPSKRIIALVPEYKGRKASAGPMIASKIGLDTLRDRCPHFAGWISRLESLGR
jgi:hypothetical protein